MGCEPDASRRRLPHMGNCADQQAYTTFISTEPSAASFQRHSALLPSVFLSTSIAGRGWIRALPLAATNSMMSRWT